MSRGEVQKILLEGLAVALVGAGLAFAANAVSPRGLALGRNYFPTGIGARASTNSTSFVIGTNATLTTGSRAVLSNFPATNDAIVERLKGKGLGWIFRAEVERLVGDGQVVFVDARDEEKFEAGHIPGAHELDPYHPERNLGNVLPLCAAAKEVVVYCAGGECEDADTVAILLRDAGVPEEKVVVYGGGMDEWSAQKRPEEKGAGN